MNVSIGETDSDLFLFLLIIWEPVCSISAQALQENVAPLLSLLRESVQLNLAPPGHFLLLGSVLIYEH